MLMVEDLLVSDDVVKEHFACDLNACKGACCWEGDFGAPLDKKELKILDDIKDKVSSYLSEASNKVLAKHGAYTYFEEMEDYGTTLMPDGACVFMTTNELGIAGCGIEQAYRDGVVDWPKPESCHLYPIRVTKNAEGNDYALNYDRWSICRNACSKKDAPQIRLFEFVKDGLIRRYGKEFYEQLDYLAGVVNGPDVPESNG
ncbi:MAG: DUF3109 family protein [Saprospiraceae bacterium]|jgi:Fe-S-cluster containining protein|nr:DUF3109 family protein [Saprospiraceae bacterium]MBX7180205.1 DUF3109 family protein [Saprospiraceae bacterium]MCB0591549.1 DUF3109 family protein [Saprospiraceae bacterium]MCO6469581.1 DUF3109 family protein [Saprospiraceae bacterium]